MKHPLHKKNVFSKKVAAVTALRSSSELAAVAWSQRLKSAMGLSVEEVEAAENEGTTWEIPMYTISVNARLMRCCRGWQSCLTVVPNTSSPSPGYSNLGGAPIPDDWDFIAGGTRSTCSPPPRTQTHILGLIAEVLKSS